MHKRLFPRVNQFTYRLSHLVVDVEKIDELADGHWFGLEKWGLSSFHRKDYGPCDGSSLNDWARKLFAEHSSGLAIERILLVTMPRMLGYVFNPVSFWLALGEKDELLAVIAEVHNTFGERHVYLCRSEDGSAIDRSTRMEALKLFHVSPFLERSGHYQFRFSLRDKGIGIWIDYFDAAGDKQLVTSMSGKFLPYSRKELMRSYFKCPLVTFKTITAIHWQALKLLLKGIRYVPKPRQLAQRVVLTKKITQS